MKKIIISLLMFLGLAVFGFAQNNQTTKNTVDQRLRSSGRVNPATLGMEFDLPLGSYPSRGFDLPLSLSYSSKVWKFEDEFYIPSSATPARSYVNGIYSENAAAGWTSSLARPYIEYTGMEKLFDQNGKPYNPTSPPPTPYSVHYIQRITVFLPGGESHELRASDAQMPFPDLGLPPDAWDDTFYATDGSGIKYVQDNGTFRLYLPDGSFYDFESGPGTGIRKATKLTDANGNFVQFNEPDTQPDIYDPYGSWTDQLGRKFPIMVPLETIRLLSGSEHVDEFRLPGMEPPYKLTWKQLGNAGVFPPNSNYAPRYIGIHTSPTSPTPGTPLPTPSVSPLFADDVVFPHQSCSSGDQPVHPLNSILRINRYNFGHPLTDVSGPFKPMVLAEIKLPNGAVYRFKYNEYGEIETIEYPFGGLEEFDYRKIDSLAGLAEGYQMTNRGVERRRVKENADASPMTYVYSAASTDDNYFTSVTAPDGTKSWTFMHRGIKPFCDRSEDGHYVYRGLKWGYDSPLAGKTFETQVFSAPDAGNNRHLLQRTVTDWTATTPNIIVSPVPTPLLIRNSLEAKYLQWNARADVTHTITYEGDSGVAAATAFEYGAADDRASPLNVTAKNEYAYTPVNDGSLPASTPAIGALVRRTETTYETSAAYTEDRNILRLPTQVLVKDGAATPSIKAKTQMAYDENTEAEPQNIVVIPGWSNPGTNIRGWLTSTKSWYDTTNNDAFVETRTEYNFLGSPVKMWDANGNLSQVKYDDKFSDGINNRNTFAFPTKSISAVPGGNGSTTAFETQTKYRFETGQVVSTKDTNNQETTMEYIDPSLRPTKIIASNGQQTVMDYGLPDLVTGQYPPSQRFVKVSSQIDANSHWEQGYTWFDGLGMMVKRQSVDAGSGDVFVDTEYDNMGRVKKVSNPYRSGDTLYWTENTYDGLNRITKVKTSGDQADMVTAYSVAATGSQIGTVETVTDEAGKTKRTIEDAFDNLIRVDEPDLNGNLGEIESPNQPTFYTYDTNENLKQIIQGGQTRNFAYDALNRLTHATNPESGTFLYTYDANGNLLTKTDARGISTTFTYDALNRVNVKNYSDLTPDVTFHYDASNVQNSKSRLTKVSSSVSETLYTSFDTSGNVLGSQQHFIDGQTHGFSYTYNLNGDLLTQTYPSGKVVRFEYDETGDLARVKHSLTFSYAQSIKYTPGGEIEQLRFGNSRWETTKFNSRRQIIEIGLGNSANDSSIWKTNYEYGDWQGTTLNPQKNNGSLARQTILVPTIANVNGFTAIQTYAYDPLDRLKSATETTSGSQTWKQTFLYDRFGNKNYDISNSNTTTLGSCATAVCNPTANLTNNRLSGYAYDLVGNITGDAEGRSFTYDAENRQISASGSNLSTSYAYDGNGERVKSHNSITNQTTYFIYDAKGKLAAEYTVNVSPPEFPTISYLTNDALGSPRVITNAYGELKARRDFFPFGDEIYAGYGSRTTSQRYSAPDDDTRQKFATYQRDAETGLDFAQSRYYSPKHGRFTSPDEFKGGPDELFDFTEDANSNPTFYADLSNPQSLNKYLYTYNNLYKFIDPDGHAPRMNYEGPREVISVNRSEQGGWTWENKGELYSRGYSNGQFRPPPRPTGRRGRNSGRRGRGATWKEGTGQAKTRQPNRFVGDHLNARWDAKARLDSYRSFRAFKLAFGPARKDHHWHHVVEQNQKQFSPYRIYSLGNTIEIPANIHTQISAFYSSKRPFSDGKRVRDWLRNQTFEQQHAFGIQKLQDFGAIPCSQ